MAFLDEVVYRANRIPLHRRPDDEDHPGQHQGCPEEPLPEASLAEKVMPVKHAEEETKALDRDHVRHLRQTDRQHVADNGDRVADSRQKRRPERLPTGVDAQLPPPAPEGDGSKGQDQERKVERGEEER